MEKSFFLKYICIGKVLYAATYSKIAVLGKLELYLLKTSTFREMKPIIKVGSSFIKNLPENKANLSQISIDIAIFETFIS